MEEDLQNFHRLLKKLCADETQGQGSYRDGRLPPIRSNIAKMKSCHLIELSNVLFEELLRRFENLHAFLRSPSDGVSGFDSKAQCSIEYFLVLLRCCLLMLQFLEFDLSFLWEKCGVLFKILGMFCPQNLALNSHECSVASAKNSFSRCFNCSLGVIHEEADQLCNFFHMIFQVFIAELSENVGLRKHLISVNVLTSNFEKLCKCHNTRAYYCTILKLVFSHFIQFMRNDLDFTRFLQSLSGSRDRDERLPEISLDVSLTLISTPFILSAPLILQAHFILLASECIITHLPAEFRMSDTPVMNCNISSFEQSVNLYLSYLSTLQDDGVILGGNGRSHFGVKAPPFELNVHKMACDKLTREANDFFDVSHLYSEFVLSGTKSEVIAYSSVYIRGDHPLIDQLCKEATCLVVNYLMERIIPTKAWKQRHNENRERIQQEIYCLAAAMKLMNASLLHIIWLLKHTEFHNHMKALRASLPCMTYEYLSQSASIIRVSGVVVDQDVQNFLCNMFGAYGGMHQEMKFMLAHISSLLIFSFKRKLDFLWKGCISIMMTLMNLLLLEERNLGLSKIFKLIQSSASMDYEALTYRNTSVKIARNLEKARMLYLHSEIKQVHFDENSLEGMDCRVMHEIEGDACNGKRFFECIPSYNSKPSEWEDLVDFIECSPEKDYKSWLKNRSKFNKWKQEKSALFKIHKQKKKRAFVKMVSSLRSRVDVSKSNVVKQKRPAMKDVHQRQRGARISSHYLLRVRH